MTKVLVGNISHTTTLQLVEVSEAETNIPHLNHLHEERFVTSEFVDLTPMVRQFLTKAEQASGMNVHPEKACFAIAGPVLNNTANLTNLSWLDGSHLSQELDIPQVFLMNDFAAVSYGVLGLTSEDLLTLQVGKPDRQAPIGVIGAGMGLGEGFVIRQGEDYRVFGTEGGHTDFAPRNELEFQLLKYLRDKMNLTQVSVERVVSSMGIVAIYQFLRDQQTITESSEVAEAIGNWEREAGMPERSVDPAAVIAIAAAEKQDHLSQKTMEIFMELYGAEAGNWALKLLPFNGLYIAGSIAAKNLALMQSGIFINSMLNKFRRGDLLEQVPVYVIRNEQVGLIGAALCAARLTRD